MVCLYWLMNGDRIFQEKDDAKKLSSFKWGGNVVKPKSRRDFHFGAMVVAVCEATRGENELL